MTHANISNLVIVSLKEETCFGVVLVNIHEYALPIQQIDKGLLHTVLLILDLSICWCSLLPDNMLNGTKHRPEARSAEGRG